MKDLDASIAEQQASLDKRKAQQATIDAKTRPLYEAALKERVRAEAEESARIHGAKKP
ncbi:MAG: hypothetical protein KBF43_15125 [Dermatophilaceae bacterium]|nr:hypothetical protein [Dermatophilaceae bacterium]